MPAPEIASPRWDTAELLQSAIDALPDPLFVKDREHRWIAVNDAFCRLIQRTRAELLGHSDPDFFPPEQVAVFWRLDDAILAGEPPNDNEEHITDASGALHTIWTRKVALRDAAGAIVGLCGMITNITGLRQRIQAAERAETELRAQAAVIATQTATLDALTTPIVEVWDQVLLVSLIGELSERRAATVMDNLLVAIRDRSTRVVLFDLTAVPALDEATALALLRTTRAASLLGCDSVLCGIRPAIAVRLATLTLDLHRIALRATVRDGLAHVMARE